MDARLNKFLDNLIALQIDAIMKDIRYVEQMLQAYFDEQIEIRLEQKQVRMKFCGTIYEYDSLHEILQAHKRLMLIMYHKHMENPDESKSDEDKIKDWFNYLKKENPNC